MSTRRWLSLMAVSVGVLLVVVVALVALAVRKYTDDRLEAQRPVVREQAERFVVGLSSLSTGQDQSAFDQLKTMATARYQAMLGAQGPAVHEVFKVGAVRSEGTVVASGFERMDADSASVLTAVETRVSDVKVPAGEVRRYRVAVQVQREAGRWLVSDVRLVP